LANNPISSGASSEKNESDDDIIFVHTKDKKATVLRTDDDFDMVSVDGSKQVKVDKKGQTEADLLKNGYSIAKTPVGVGDGAIGGAVVWLAGAKLFNWAFGAVASWFATSASEAAVAEMTTVGRWMSEAEYKIMLNTGRVVEGGGGQTMVDVGGGPTSFAAAAKGSVYVQFQVPTNSLLQAGRAGSS